MHHYPNGRIPSSALTGIPGNGRLWTPAARAYIAMAIVINARLGVSMTLIEGAMRRTYRELAAQFLARNYWCGLGKCGNAAVPGTSNHGLGLASDLMSMAQRIAVDKLGRAFGFAKAWSDAPQEWWHLKWREGVWSAPRWPRTLHRGQHGKTVSHLQGLLRSHGRTGSHHPHHNVYRAVPKKHARGRGHFGLKTKRAVVQFQKSNHLTADGVVGPQTWRKLGVRPN